ncbi:MAG: putative membrane protein YfcA [Candidatus Azotimanducaceae bacterium]
MDTFTSFGHLEDNGLSHHDIWAMELNSLLILLLIVFGTIVQTTTGFAMGLIIIGGVTVLGLAEIEMAAAIVSLISLVNAFVALRYSYKYVDKEFLKWIALGMLPMILLGVFILDYLSGESGVFLRKLLGFVIVSAGILLMLKPTPFPKVSGKLTQIMVGASGGLMGGMYGAGGAPLAYLMYRQPLDLNVIRATLLGSFALSTIFRTLSISVAGQVTGDVLKLVGLAVPLVIVVTLLTNKVTHLLPDVLIRRFVFILLIFLGLFLIYQ